MNHSPRNLVIISEKLDLWMRECAWPLWWKAGRHENGSFYEALDFSGQAIPEPIARVRVQARQVYSFALAWSLGWRAEFLEEKLVQSLDRFLGTCLGTEGIPGMLVDIETGRMSDPRPNLYVTAFTLLALAQARQVIGGPDHDRRIERLLENVDRCLAYPDGRGYREFLPPEKARYQNPHMHFYESLLLLYDVTGDPGVGKRAERLLDFVRATFFGDGFGIVQEKVDPNSPDDFRKYEPGHSMEWVWLLGLRSRLFRLPLDPFAIELYENYCSSGIEEGSTPMCLSAEHEPIDPSCRLWSQTEALKAHLTIAELGPGRLFQGALNRALVTAWAIHDRWLGTGQPGLFHDHFNADGSLRSRNVPGSMGYHLYVAIMELSRSARELKYD